MTHPWIENPASWVIREITTKRVIMETFQRAVVDALNTARYEAVPIYAYLVELNQEIREEAA